MSVARYWKESLELPSRHPNELDQRRIARALKQRNATAMSSRRCCR